MVDQPCRNFMKIASWSRTSEHLVNSIGMSDQLKWNNHTKSITNIIDRFFDNIVKESPNIKYHTVNAILNLVHIFMMFVFV